MMDNFIYDLSKLSQLVSSKCQIYFFKRVSSTQILAKKNIIEGNHSLCVFLADEQKAGHGRFGRPFFSPAKTGIYLSINIPMTVENGGLFTTGLAVTLADVLTAFYPYKEIKLKWVNDLYYQNKKIGGLLVERVNGMIVCGIGINLTSNNFPQNLHNIATSIDNGHTAKIDRTELVAAIINQIISDAPYYQSGQFMLRYRQRSLLLGKTITIKVNGGFIHGIAKQIDDNGSLVVYDPGTKQEYTLVSGEVVKVFF